MVKNKMKTARRARGLQTRRALKGRKQRAFKRERRNRSAGREKRGQKGRGVMIIDTRPIVART